MKLWKSPVLYIGLLLIVAVIGALLAPYVVDWSVYRADLQKYGRKLTGREVTIMGSIAVRLFPWPSLTAEDIHLANPPGFEAADFAHAERIAVRLQLASLFNGTIQVDSIDIDRPVVTVERLTSGAGNWLLKPSAGLAGNDLLGRVKLDHISLKDATVYVIDGRRGNGEMAFSLPQATLTSPGIAGPWRVRASGVQYGGQGFDVTFNTGAYKPGEAFHFGFGVRPGSDATPALAKSSFDYSVNFEGASQDGRLTGAIRLEPVIAENGKTDAEGQLRPFAVTSKVDANFEAVAFDAIEISPLDPGDGGRLMSGSAKLTLGRQIAATVELSATRLDLGTWAGARVNGALREGGGLAAADSLLALMPNDAKLNGRLKVTALQAGGETLENIDLAIGANHDFISIENLTAALPGQSHLQFRGTFFRGETGGKLDGQLHLDSTDLRKFTGWVMPGGKPLVTKLWTGSRGRLSLDSKVNFDPASYRLGDVKYEIDGETGSAQLTVSTGGRGAVDLRIDASKIDIDNFVPGGIAAASGLDGSALAGILPLLVPQKSSRDLRLTVHTGELLLNGVSANDVRIDVAAGANGLDIRTIEIGSVGGAKLTASGLILDAGQGPDGSIGIDVAADDPRGLLRLLGLLPGDRDPAWTAALGKTAVKGTLNVKTTADGPVAGFHAEGASGDFDIRNFDFDATGLKLADAAGGQLQVSGSAEIRAASSGSLAKLIGLTPVAADQTPARLVLTGAGSLADGFLADLQLQAYGMRFAFNGTVGATGPSFDGKLSLAGTDVAPLLSAMGIQSTPATPQVLVLDGQVTTKDRAYKVNQIDGRFGSSPITGSLAIAPGAVVTANLDTGPLSLADVLPAVFLAWNGTAAGMDSSFAAVLPLGITGNIYINAKALQVHDTFAASDAFIGIEAKPGEVDFVARGKDAAGRDAAIEISSKGTDSNRAIDGKITLPVDLASQLRLAGGAPVAQGSGIVDLHIVAGGRSPAGALSVLRGSGSYAIGQLKLLNISPKDFATALAAAKDGAGLTAAFDALRGGGGMAVGDARGSIIIDSGIAAFLPIAISTADADASIKTTADLSAGTIDAAVTLSLKAAAGLPAMEIAYAGPPSALARSEDKAELSSKLGYGIMQQGVVELEHLQQEQQRLAVEEEKQRKEDEAKLAAYYAQRDELLLRRRELKVFSEMRVIAAEKLRQQIESARAANTEINRSELKQRQRELKVFRRMAKLDRQPDLFAVSPPQKAKPAPVKSAPKPDLQPPFVLFPPVQSPSQQ